ncbi:MAG: esterase family protein [Prevotellaceae bacterium]|jgi:S-formylglutathione hydrolase FrmB|nr:esterase family protein [Prevotellaceae bacterium]
MKTKFILVTLFLTVSLAGYAARIDTVMVKSASMNKDVLAVFVIPDVVTGREAKACPVVFLLHGYGGNAYGWLSAKPELPAIADEKGIIFVCPDAKNSWYWDSPTDPAYRYETFVATELVNYTDAHYKTIAAREGRAITGLSMGGHGALWLAFRHTDVFGAAGSTSGGVDFRPFPEKWEISNQLGDYNTHRDRWSEYTVVGQVSKIKDGDLALIVDCGLDDFFLDINISLHLLLKSNHISHDFILRPGKHNMAYWNNSIDYQILFFSKYFSPNEKR